MLIHNEKTYKKYKTYKNSANYNLTNSLKVNFLKLDFFYIGNNGCRYYSN